MLDLQNDPEKESVIWMLDHQNDPENDPEIWMLNLETILTPISGSIVL